MKIHRRSILFILGGLSAVGPFSIDMYLPGFPQIAADLDTHLIRVGYSLTSYFIGICVGQLIYGPLMDRFGRKKPLLAGISLYILTSLGCMFSPSIDTFIGLRALQALGGCVGMVASRAIVRDLFLPHETAKIFSLLMLMTGVAPIVAPTVGGMVAASLGWQAIFLILALLGSLLLLSVKLFLPESKSPDDSVSLKPLKMLARYRDLTRNSRFLTYVLASAALSCGLYAYIAGSPAIYMKLFGLSEQQYGWIYAVNALGLIGGSQLNHLLLRKFKSERVSFALSLVQVGAGAALVFFASEQFFSTWGLYGVIFLFLMTHGILSPNTSALAINPMGAAAGSASSLMGFIQMLFGSLSTGLVSVLHNGSALPMAQVMLGFALMGFLFLWLGLKNAPERKNQGHPVLDSVS